MLARVHARARVDATSTSKEYRRCCCSDTFAQGSSSVIACSHVDWGVVPCHRDTMGGSCGQVLHTASPLRCCDRFDSIALLQQWFRSTSPPHREQNIRHFQHELCAHVSTRFWGAASGVVQLCQHKSCLCGNESRSSICTQECCWCRFSPGAAIDEGVASAVFLRLPVLKPET